MTTPTMIVLFVILDVIILALVLRRFVKVKGSLNVSFQGLDFRQLSRFAKDMHAETERYLQSNYSGDPRQLPDAMQGLLSLARSRAEQEGLALDAAMLKQLVAALVRKHRVAKAEEIRSALDRAA